MRTLLSARPVTMGTKKTVGFCVICSAVATTEALLKVPDAAIIQRFCDACPPKANYVL